MRLVLCLLLALAAAPAWADWVKLDESDRANFYLDPATIRKDGNLRRVWTIHDLKKRDKDGVKSRRSLMEYDCKVERFRFLSYSMHSDYLAQGNTLVSERGSEKWDDIPPGTPVERILKIVCGQ